jgi:hypothetical protein
MTCRSTKAMLHTICRAPSFRWIGGHQLGIDEESAYPRYVLVFLDESAVGRGQVSIPKDDTQLFRSSRIYARTARNVFRLEVRSLIRLPKLVDLAGFVFVHNSSLLNVSKIAELETRGNINLALFEASSGHREMLLISRRGMAALAAKILLRQSLRLGRVSPACPADADS